MTVSVADFAFSAVQKTSFSIVLTSKLARVEGDFPLMAMFALVEG